MGFWVKMFGCYLVFWNVVSHIESSVLSFVLLTINLQPATSRTHCWKAFGTKKIFLNFRKKLSKNKFWKKNFSKKYFGKKTKTLKTKIYNINKCDTIFAFLTPLDRDREKHREEYLLQGLIRAITPEGIMKKSAHVHSALVQNKQFRARIARKECGHLNEVRRKNF